jgi:hypothetical protein
MNDLDYCYYCGSETEATTHVPPKAIFPELKDSPGGRDYRKNLIQVPSCETHNLVKSNEDEYLLYVLVMSLPSNEVAKSQFLTKIRRAIDRRPKLLSRLLRETREFVVHDTANDAWSRTIAIRPEERRLVGIFTCIAKALYFQEMKCRWQGTVSVLIEFMLSFDNIAQNEKQRQVEEQLNSMLENVPRKGENPDVFSYQFVKMDDKFLVRLHFYGNTRVSAVYVANNG